MTLILKSAEKHFKATMINLFKAIKKNIDITNEREKLTGGGKIVRGEKKQMGLTERKWQNKFKSSYSNYIKCK